MSPKGPFSKVNIVLETFINITTKDIININKLSPKVAKVKFLKICIPTNVSLAPKEIKLAATNKLIKSVLCLT